jgi:hypothetical protein
MPRMKLTITSAHIEKSIRNDANHCMIASALKEKIPTARWVAVDLQKMRWTDRVAGKQFVGLTPLPAKRALLAFDKGEDVKPFEFTMPELQTKPIYKNPKAAAKAKAQAKVRTKKAKTKKVYKKAKVAPERVAVRRHGLRMFE